MKCAKFDIMNMNTNIDSRPKEIIRRLGGSTKTAELCEITTGAVSQWKKKGIPKPRLMFLKLARPDVFGLLPPKTTDGNTFFDV